MISHPCPVCDAPKESTSRFQKRSTASWAPRWTVVARTREGRDVVTVAAIPEEIARYLARRFERYLT